MIDGKSERLIVSKRPPSPRWIWCSLVLAELSEIIEQQSLRNPLIDVRLKRGWLLRESKKKSISLVVVDDLFPDSCADRFSIKARVAT